jgi:hypothetical protein
MNRITRSFCVSFTLLAVGLIARPMVTEGHGIAPTNSVVVTAAQCESESTAGKIVETGTGNERITSYGSSKKKQTRQSAEKSVPTRLVGPGEKQSYDATRTIAVGGEGKNFTVQEGGKAVLTSGLSIRLLPGTMIEAGGQLVVKVTATRKLSGLGKKTTTVNPDQNNSSTSKTSIDEVNAYKIYPVPEPGSIMSSVDGITGVLPIQLRISNPDVLLLSKKLSFSPFNDPALDGSESELSFCNFSWGENPATIRVMRV